jgi:hypothetical protein
MSKDGIKHVHKNRDKQRQLGQNEKFSKFNRASHYVARRK